MTFPCPGPEHIQKAVEIRKSVRHAAFMFSWPSDATTAALFALTALVALVIQWLHAATPAFYWVLWLAILSPPTYIENWADRKFLGVDKPPRLTSSFPGQGLPWWGHLGAAVVAVLFALFVENVSQGALVLAVLWLWIGLVTMANGWLNRRGHQISLGMIFLALGIVSARSLPEDTFSAFFVPLLTCFAITSAGFAYWEWRAWKKGAVSVEDFSTGLRL